MSEGVIILSGSLIIFGTCRGFLVSRFYRGLAARGLAARGFAVRGFAVRGFVVCDPYIGES